MLRLLIPVLLLLWLPSAFAESPHRDQVWLKNGSKLIGTIVSARGGQLVLATDFAGEISIDAAQVDAFSSPQSVTLKLTTGEIIRNRPVTYENEQLVITDANDKALSFAVDQIELLNPEEWELGNGYHWDGRISAGLQALRGNSNTDEYSYNFFTQVESLLDRYTVHLDGELKRANGIDNADNTIATGKYDRFLRGGPWYWGANVSAKQDQFADLDLRAYIGPYLGRHLIEDPRLDLRLEVGLIHVEEQFIVAQDRDYTGTNWNLWIESDILGGDSRLYVYQVGILNLESQGDALIDTTAGLAFPLLFDLEASAEVKLFYNSGAAPGVQELDQSYAFRIGYTW